jgi:hypothetical protein
MVVSVVVDARVVRRAARRNAAASEPRPIVEREAPSADPRLPFAAKVVCFGWRRIAVSELPDVELEVLRPAEIDRRPFSAKRSFVIGFALKARSAPVSRPIDWNRCGHGAVSAGDPCAAFLSGWSIGMIGILPTFAMKREEMTAPRSRSETPPLDREVARRRYRLNALP